MASYAGLDVSQQETHLCVIEASGRALWRGKVATDPEAIARVLARKAPGLERAVMETGALAPWLWHGLFGLGVPILCIEARRAHAALRQSPSKSDVGDAEGLARLAQTGWFKEVKIKSVASQERRALLAARERLVRIQGTLTNQIRGLLKPFGLLVGQVSGGRFAAKVEALIADRPGLRQAIAPLLGVLAAVARELAPLDDALVRQAGTDPDCRRLVTIPGIGPVTAQAFMAAIDDPARFASSHAVPAWCGLTPRRWQSGEVDLNGRISKCGDGMLRHLLYEAANSIIARLKRPCALKAWALGLERRLGAKKARTALARKLAVLMHRIWITGGRFDWRRAAA